MLTGDTQVSIVSSFINILMSYIINTSSKLVICNPQVCIKPTQATWSLFYKRSTVSLWLSNCNVVTRAYYKRTSDCNRASDKTLQVCFENQICVIIRRGSFCSQNHSVIFHSETNTSEGKLYQFSISA